MAEEPKFLYPGTNDVAEIATEVFDVLVKYPTPQALMALLLNLNFMLKRVGEKSSPPAEIETLIGELRERINLLADAIAGLALDPEGECPKAPVSPL